MWIVLGHWLGKAIADSTIIPTPTGQKTVGEVEVGDHLYDRKGNPTKVLAVYPHKNKRAFKVTLKDSRSFICCDEHLIPYYTKDNMTTIKNRTLGEMLVNYKRTDKNGFTIYKYRIPQNEAVEFEEKQHVIHPYVLGALIGDGLLGNYTNSMAMSSNEKDIVYKVADLAGIPHENIIKSPHNYNWAFTNHENAKIVRDELKRLGLRGTTSRTKFIPEKYLYDSIENRMQLIKGLIDTDGHAKISHMGSLHYSYSTMNEDLAEQVRQLCLSLGFGVNVNKYVYDDELHDISVRIFTPETIVSSEKHLATIKNGEYRSTYDRMTPIVDIQEVAPRDMTCFTVDNPEHLYLINDFIVTHNTLVTLTALVELAQQNRLHGHVLIIAPKRIAINTWPDEITKWDHTKNGKFVQLAGLSKKKRDKILDTVESSPPTIYIINRELVPKLVQRFPDKKWAFLNVVIDEAQSFKGYGSQGFKALKSIAPFTHRWIELTGSPSSNGLMDIWSLIFLLDGGQRLGKNITAYRNQHFIPGRRTPEGYPYEWLLIDGHEQIIHSKIQDVAISMMKKDYLDMPGLTHNVIELDMTKSERSVYNELKKEKILPLVTGDVIEAANAAVLSGALLQLSNGAIYADEEKKEIIELHDHKLKALEEIIEGSNGQPILCFYWFKHDLIRLTNKFPDGEIFTGKPEQLARWNNKEIPLLFAQPQSAGHGLNFQYGGHILVFFVVPRSLELYEQSIGRLYRNGQTEAVVVHYLKTRGTVEDRVIATLINKQFSQQALIDAVKADINDLL